MWTCRDKALVDAMKPIAAPKAGVNRLPNSFQPDFMSSHGQSPLVERLWANTAASDGGNSGARSNSASCAANNNFHAEFYLTQPRAESEFLGANIHPDTQAALRFAPSMYMGTRGSYFTSFALLSLKRSSFMLALSPPLHKGLSFSRAYPVVDFPRFQRPDVPRIVATMAAACASRGGTRVAVLTCGPAGLVASVVAACDGHNNGAAVINKVYFDIHVETFEL